jgi:prevent-host-death family protein
MRVSITEAKGQLTELVRRVAAGEEVILTRRGQAVAKLVPFVVKPTPEEKAAVLERIRKSAAKNKKARRGPSAARSQDFLYDENGLPN